MNFSQDNAPVVQRGQGAVPLVEQVVQALREEILSGRYDATGQLPPQGELCQRYGVSRSVIREAMRQLESQRLLTVGRGRRPQLAPLNGQAVAESLQILLRRSGATLFHLMQIRQVLEVEIARLAARNMDEETLLRLHVAVKQQEQAQDVEQQIRADLAFHRILAEATGNPLFVFLMDALAELMYESRKTTIGRGLNSRAVAGHRGILAALASGDEEKVVQAMQAHLADAAEDLEKLADPGPAQGSQPDWN